MIESDELRTSLRDLAEIFFRRFWSMAAIFVLTLGGATAWQVLLRNDLYEATATLLVKFVPEQGTQATMDGSRSQVIGYRQQDVNSEVEIIRSVQLVSRVVDKLGLDKHAPAPVPEGFWRRVRYEAKEFVSEIRKWIDEVMINAGLRLRLSDREKAIAALSAGLKVSTQGDSNIIDVRLTMPDRMKVAAVLNTLVDMYLKTRYQLFEDKGAAGVFEKQAKDMQRRLTHAGQKMERLNLGTSLEAITARKEILLRRASDIQAHLNNDVVRLSESQGNLDSLREQLSSSHPNIGAVGTFKAGTLEQSLLKQMADLRREEEQLRMTEMDGSVRLTNVHSQFLALAAIMESNLESTVRERRDAVWSREKELADINDELASVQERESKWVALKREDRILEQRYAFYQKKYEDAVASLAMERARIGNVVVVQPAQDPLRTVGVSRSVFILIATVLAAFGALSWSVVVEFLDHRVRTIGEVERWLAAPAFAAVPLDKSASRGAGRAPRSFGQQQRRSFRKAALALVKALRQAGAKTVALSGTGAGAGATTITLQIAAHMRAIFDCDVVIVELDAGRAVLCDALGLDPERTWQACLRDERALADCLQDGPRGVKILASAPSTRHELDFSFGRLAQLLHELHRRFDHVLLDMPPALERPEFLAAGETVPPVVIVVEAERARHEVLQRIRTELAHDGITLLGAILNKQRRYIPSWAYRAIVE